MSSENTKVPLPELKGATLEVHWADFKKLIERRAAAMPKVPKTPPPMEFVFGPADVEGEVSTGAPAPSARLKATFDLNVLAEAWVRVPLLEGDVALTRATIDGDDLAIDPTDTSPLSAMVKGPGEHRVTLEFATPLLTEADQSAFEFSIPGPPVVNLSVKIPKTKLSAEVDPAVSTETKEEGGGTTVKAAVPSGQTTRVSWTRAAEKPKDVPVEPAQLFARTETWIGLGDGLSRVVATVTVNVLKSAVRTFTFDVPGDATVAKVSGPMVGNWEAKAGKAGATQAVVVELKGDFKGTTPVAIELDRAWDEKPPYAIPLVTMRGVERESGFVAISALTTIEITPADVKELQRIDVKELPRTLTMRPNPVILAFKFREAGGSLTVNVQKHAELPVVTGMADASVHTVLQTADGKRVTRSTWSVRNSQRQFVRIQLPKGSTVWSTVLDGAPVKPASGGDDVVLIPLKKAASFQDTETPFEVEVVTIAESGAMGEKGKLSLLLPRCDLPVAALRLSLWVPDGWLYDDFTGSLEEVRGYRDPWRPEGTVSQAMAHVSPPTTGATISAPPQPRPTPPPPPPAAPPPMAMPAQAPSPNAAMSKVVMEAPSDLRRMKRASGKGMGGGSLGSMKDEAGAPAMDELSLGDDLYGTSEDAGSPPDAELLQLALAAPKDAGVLPVRMTVPEKGLHYAFEKLLVLEEVLLVETEYAREKIVR